MGGERRRVEELHGSCNSFWGPGRAPPKAWPLGVPGERASSLLTPPPDPRGALGTGAGPGRRGEPDARPRRVAARVACVSVAPAEAGDVPVARGGTRDEGKTSRESRPLRPVWAGRSGPGDWNPFGCHPYAPLGGGRGERTPESFLWARPAPLPKGTEAKGGSERDIKRAWSGDGTR